MILSYSCWSLVHGWLVDSHAVMQYINHIYRTSNIYTLFCNCRLQMYTRLNALLFMPLLIMHSDRVWDSFRNYDFFAGWYVQDCTEQNCTLLSSFCTRRSLMTLVNVPSIFLGPSNWCLCFLLQRSLRRFLLSVDMSRSHTRRVPTRSKIWEREIFNQVALFASFVT